MTSFYSPHDASERILASGRPLVSGEYFELTTEEQKEPHNQRLLEDGQIQKVPAKKKEAES